MGWVAFNGRGSIPKTEQAILGDGGDPAVLWRRRSQQGDGMVQQRPQSQTGAVRSRNPSRCESLRPPRFGRSSCSHRATARRFGIEPYTCITDAINRQPQGIDAGLQVIAPGEEWRGTVLLEVNEG